MDVVFVVPPNIYLLEIVPGKALHSIVKINLKRFVYFQHNMSVYVRYIHPPFLSRAVNRAVLWRTGLSQTLQAPTAGISNSYSYDLLPQSGYNRDDRSSACDVPAGSMFVRCGPSILVILHTLHLYRTSFFHSYRLRGVVSMIRRLGIVTGKTVVIVGLTFFALVQVVGIIYMAALLLGPGKDDVALFHGKGYSISRTADGYDLYDRRSGHPSVLLPNVIAYCPGKEKSYIRSYTELVVIDEKRGTYERISLAKANPEDLEMLDRMIEVKRSLR